METASQQRIKAMLEKLLSELPPGAAVLRERRTRRDDGTLFELIPSNHDAAAILVHVEDRFDLVDFSFGESGTWELPVEGRNRNAGIDGILSEVEDMCRAVIAGNCECRQNRFSSVSRIFVDGFACQVRNILQLSMRTRTTRYLPYHDGLRIRG